MAKRLQDLHPALSLAICNRDRALPLADLAKSTHRSPFHLQRLFTQATGESPKQYSLRLRLERAAARLVTTDHSILDIALDCGFQSHEVFTRAFERKFSLTPSDYRRQGLPHAPTADDGRAHAKWVEAIGPCIGLYHFLDSKPKEKPVSYTVAKVDLAAQPVIAIRKQTPRSSIAATIGQSLPLVFQYSQKHGLAIAGHPLVRYYEVGPGLWTIEPSMRVTTSVEVPPPPTAIALDSVRLDTLPAGATAMTLHLGPYDLLPDAYAALELWMKENNYKPSAAPWESYINDPGNFPDPKDWQTEVFWPVQPA